MNIKDINQDVVTVRVKATGRVFNLSHVKLHGVIGLAAFPVNGKRPRTGKHMMLDAGSREAWLNELETVCLNSTPKTPFDAATGTPEGKEVVL